MYKKNSKTFLYVQPSSVKSVSLSSTAGPVATTATSTTPAVSWTRASQARYVGSDTASLSGDSHSSRRNSTQEVIYYPPCIHVSIGTCVTNESRARLMLTLVLCSFLKGPLDSCAESM